MYFCNMLESRCEGLNSAFLPPERQKSPFGFRNLRAAIEIVVPGWLPQFFRIQCDGLERECQPLYDTEFFRFSVCRARERQEFGAKSRNLGSWQVAWWRGGLSLYYT
jgi:hypothetical protein